MSIATLEAEYLAPTVDTSTIALISPDRRYTKLRDIAGHVEAHLVKIPLHRDGLPVWVRPFPAQGGPPKLAYTAVGNDDTIQFPSLAWALSDRIGALVAAGLGVIALVTAALGARLVTR